MTDLAISDVRTEVRIRSVEPFDVLDTCHKQMVVNLRLLQDLVDHLDAVKGVDTKARALAKTIYDFFSEVARQHHLDEEKHVFPAMLRSGDDELIRHTLRLQQDHGWIEEDWLEMAPQLESIAAGYTWYNLEQLSLAVPVFVQLYQDHLALEESLIYPEAKARISEWDLQGAGREMALRRREQMA